MTKKKKLSKKQEDLSLETPKHLLGFSYITFSVLLFLSLASFAYLPPSHNWLGILGVYMGKYVHALFGLTSYFFCFYLMLKGIKHALGDKIELPKRPACLTLLFSICLMLSVIEQAFPAAFVQISTWMYPAVWANQIRFHLGGAPFFYLYKDLPGYNLHNMISPVGTFVLFAFIGTYAALNLLDIHLERALYAAASFGKKLFLPIRLLFFPLFRKSPPSFAAENERVVKLKNFTSSKKALAKGEESVLTISPQTELTERPSFSKPSTKTVEATLLLPEPVKPKRSAAKVQIELPSSPSITKGEYANYAIPSPSLLANPKKVDQTTLKNDLRRQAEVLEETLFSFGIEAKVGQINCGPRINSFEVHPSIGVKVQKIKALESDIALNMEAKSIRIIAPIPGKAAVGIEIPSTISQEVSFKELLHSYLSSSQKMQIPLLLGKSVSGEEVFSDLAKMPHCIIAGATGSGKSVCINTIVMSIVMTAKPDEVKLLMVDPKKVELTPYSRLPHMLAPVITEAHGAMAALTWLVKEMEKRYEILKQLGYRNILSFNARQPDLEFESTFSIEIPEKMNYIVCIIDELADLMMVSSDDIETPIARIAQMARAVGIHMILATQRPSREVITGLIKANFPTRISFKVASRVNSQIILDETGAEQLLGNGDMLFLPPASSHVLRAQGAFIRDEDINKVIDWACEQAPTRYVIDSFDTFSLEELREEEVPPQDPLYQQALTIVTETGKASTTFLQRKMKIGYSTAARLMDELEAHGVVGPQDGAKPREIYAKLADNSSDEELSPPNLITE
jgi:S-DNA-T family DNA segregation ATPase FtsK/SpoIIIE